MEKPTVVISDLHGQIQKLISVLMHYGNDYGYIFNGDVIDRGPDSKGTLEVIQSMGNAATLLTGNHEWVLRAALGDIDSLRRDMWRDEVWLNPSTKRRLESRMLESYGVVTDRPNEELAKELRYKMQQTGHLALLETAGMYYENEDLLVLHAGPDDSRSWQSQRKDLDTFETLARNGIFDDEPRQLFDFKLSNVAQPPKDIYNKTLITGHTHLRIAEKGRIWWGSTIHRPSRVRLASHMKGGDPLFVYETDTLEVHAF